MSQARKVVVVVTIGVEKLKFLGTDRLGISDGKSLNNFSKNKSGVSDL